MDTILRESAPSGSAHSPFILYIGIVLLAAGQSKRMGVNKQLLPWKGKTVLDTVCAALREGWEEDFSDQIINRNTPSIRIDGKLFIAVIGNQDRYEMQDIVERCGFAAIHNEWSEEGQGLSIALGVEQLLRENPMILDGVICSVADQPLLEPFVIRQLIATFRSNPNRVDGDGLCRSIIVPLYGPLRKPGNPVLFGSYWFGALTRNKGDKGGKTIIHGPGKNYVQHIWISVDIGDDIDTPEDFQRISNRESEDV